MGRDGPFEGRKMKSPHNDPQYVGPQQEPDRIVRPNEAEEIVQVSWQTIKRCKRKKILALGKRAVGIWLSDLLAPP
jgi:hypothetical protein